MKGILWGLLLGFCGSAFAQQKHALLIGINTYEPEGGLPAGSAVSGRSGFSNLDGCVNDALAMKALLLARFGFQPEKITELYNRDATRQRIMDEVAALTQRVSAGDVVFIFYAGHGSQQPNSLSPEGDKLDETLVPADAWKNPFSDIRDKEQRIWYNGLLGRGAHLTVIFDCCHSGSMSRGGEPVYNRPRFRKIEPATADARDPGTAPDPLSLAGDRLLVMSAAQDFELAAEAKDAEGRPHGAFTMALITALSQMPAGTSAENLFSAVRNILKSNGVAQEPQLVGSNTRLQQNLMGVAAASLSDKPVVSVRKGAGGVLEISGGSGLALRKGNEFTMIGNREVVLKIDSVTGIAGSRVRLLKGAAQLVKPGSLFELSNWVSDEQPLLRVFIPANPFGYDDVANIARRFQALRNAAPEKWISSLRNEVPDVSAWYVNGVLQMMVKGNIIDSANWLQLEQIMQGKDVRKGIFYLPVPRELQGALAGYFQQGSSYELTTDASAAQYHVSGQVNERGQPAFYLMNKASASKDSLEALPNETNRHVLPDITTASLTDVASRLFEYAVRIGRVRGWLHMQGPGNQDFPFELVIADEKGRPAGTEGLKVGQAATLTMVASAEQNVAQMNIRQKYVYAFAIDKEGAMSLLYPEKGSGERFPQRDAQGNWITSYAFGSFETIEPVGTDNFFLLAVTEPIANPQAIFNQEGVFTSRNGSLKGLLDPLLNMGTRGARLGRIETPNDWNLLRLSLKVRH